MPDGADGWVDYVGEPVKPHDHDHADDAADDHTARCGSPPGAQVVAALPSITEVKRTLAGVEKRFSCRVLTRDGSHVVVLFIAPAPMNVHGVALPAGTVTFGHFWTDRPYNVYHWLEQSTGATIGYYLNLSHDTRLTGALLEWLDLAVDILLVPPRPAVLLDEDEIPSDPSDASAELRERIAGAKKRALAELPVTIAEVERQRVKLWPLATGTAPVKSAG
jgi:hypothetical protein